MAKAKKYIAGILLLIVVAILAVVLFGDDVYVNRNPSPPVVNDAVPYEFKIVDTLKFELGSQATPYFRSIDFFEDNSKRSFSFYNEYTEQIYVYNYDSPGRPLKKITLKNEVTESLSQITGYTIHNIDSILVYGYKNQTIALVNSDGNLLDIFEWQKMLKEDVSFLPNPTAWSFSPMVYKSGKIIMSGWSVGEGTLSDKHDRPITVIVDLKKKKAWFDGFYPDVYRKGNWGGVHFRKVYSAYNAGKNVWAYSFPASHYVYSTHHGAGEKLRKHYAGSKQISSVKSMDNPIGSYAPTSWRKKYFALNNSFSAIFYDNWNERYYRFAEKKFDKYDGELYKQKIIILLNEKLKYISEVDLSKLTSDKIYIYGVFVTEEGLNLQILNENEDQIFILILKFHPK